MITLREYHRLGAEVEDGVIDGEFVAPKRKQKTVSAKIVEQFSSADRFHFPHPQSFIVRGS
jgi:hypothetical protein